MRKERGERARGRACPRSRARSRESQGGPWLSALSLSTLHVQRVSKVRVFASHTHTHTHTHARTHARTSFSSVRVKIVRERPMLGALLRRVDALGGPAASSGSGAVAMGVDDRVGCVISSSNAVRSRACPRGAYALSLSAAKCDSANLDPARACAALFAAFTRPSLQNAYAPRACSGTRRAGRGQTRPCALCTCV